jgi:hypothetical protein
MLILRKKKILNIREYALNDNIKIFLNVTFSVDNAHVSGEKPLEVELSQSKNVFL